MASDVLDGMSKVDSEISESSHFADLPTGKLSPPFSSCWTIMGTCWVGHKSSNLICQKRIPSLSSRWPPLISNLAHSLLVMLYFAIQNASFDAVFPFDVAEKKFNLLKCFWLTRKTTKHFPQFLHFCNIVSTFLQNWIRCGRELFSYFTILQLDPGVDSATRALGESFSHAVTLRYS